MKHFSQRDRLIFPRFFWFLILPGGGGGSGVEEEGWQAVNILYRPKESSCLFRFFFE